MIGTYKYKVAPKEVDFSAQMTLVSLADRILETAGDNAEAIGFGTSTLNGQNKTWVLSRFAINVERYLTIYEEFTITTWIESADKICSLRSFTVEDMQGSRVATASTLWSILDLDTRRVCDLSLLGDYHTFIEERKNVLVARPAKLHIKKEYDSSYSHVVRYLDIDFNGHTNSTSYIGWMVNYLDLDWFRSNMIKGITLNFLHESLYGDCVALSQRTAENKLECAITKCDSTTVCLLELMLQKK